MFWSAVIERASLITAQAVSGTTRYAVCHQPIHGSYLDIGKRSHRAARGLYSAWIGVLTSTDTLGYSVQLESETLEPEFAGQINKQMYSCVYLACKMFNTFLNNNNNNKLE